MDNSKRGHIPKQEKLDLNKSQGAQTPKEVNRMKNVPYALVVGSIMYAVRCTRPDVVFAQNITSRFQQNPELRVEYYCNAGFEIDINDMKSLTGYILNRSAAKVENLSMEEHGLDKKIRWLFVTKEDIKSLPASCQFEEKHEEINHVEANSSIPSTSEMIEIQVQK
ncbi:hypothetical protein Tco_0622728 [Tanacetum coccineum]